MSLALIPSASPTLESLTKTGAISKGGASQILASYRRMLDSGALSKGKAAAVSAVEGGAVIGAAGLVGGALGAMHCLMPNGLDVTIPGTKHSVPVDLAAAGLGFAGGVAASLDGKPGIGQLVHGMAATCMGIYSFRTVHDAITKMRATASGATAGGGATVAGLNKIGKAQFAGEFGAEANAPNTWAPGSRSYVAGSEDPVVAAAVGL